MRFERKIGFYEKYIKRLLDIFCSLLFIIVFCWLYAIIAVIVRVKMGSPVLFKQPRPGIIKNGKETIFDMYKFRSMTDKRDENGEPAAG
jgi:lipopolysaccharide/colanic/teichoic acid biosynthesis glycosyltransferase